MPNSSARRPVASLSRLSPSSTSTMRRGSPSRRAMLVAAIASVGATTAPRTIPSRQSNPANAERAARATPSTVNATRPNVSERMLTRL